MNGYFGWSKVNKRLEVAFINSKKYTLKLKSIFRICQSEKQMGVYQSFYFLPHFFKSLELFAPAALFSIFQMGE